MGNVIFLSGLVGMAFSVLLILILLSVFRRQRKKLLRQMEEE